MTLIVGVDPGTTTGIFAVRASTLLTYDVTEVRSDFTSYELDVRKAYAAVELQLRSDPVVDVACERYVITTRTARLTQQPTALELIGALRELCARYDAPLTLQMKSDAAQLAKNHVLKRIGWFQRGQDHANDAARHALLRLASVQPLVFNALLTSGSIVSTSR